MNKRLRVIAWVTTCIALAGLLFWAYRRFVLLHPDPTLSWVRNGVTYELLNPKMLGAVLLAPWFVAVLSQSLADLPWPQRILSVLLRVSFVVLLALGLSRLARTATTEKVCTVYLVDVSDSVTDEALDDARAAVAKAWAEKPKDGLVKLVTFARRPRLVEAPDAGGDDKAKPPAVERHADANGQRGDLGAGSNLQAALQLAYGLYPQGYLKRAVLLTDGVQTEGDLLAEANRAKDFGVKLFTIPYRRPAPPEVAIREMKMPDRVKVGETFAIHADIYASRATKARARLFQGEALNGLEGLKELDLKAGPNDVVFKSVVRIAGQVTYALEIDEIPADKFKENNRYATTIDVPGRPAVLYVEGTPQHAGPLSNALTAQQLDVDVRPPAGFPGSLKELERYDFVILSDTPKEAVSLQAQELIETYVRDLGGGFLFAGGESGYGLGGWYHTTIERILPVRMDNERKKEMPSVAMALVIDRSGSMTGLPLEMAKAAAKATAQTLGSDDLLEVIAFDSAPTRYVKMQPARNRSRIANEIARIQPGGGTEIFPALDAAYQDMTVTQARKKHVVLLTDGKASTSGIRDLVSAMIAESITVTTVGLGGDVDEQLLKMIADVGGGRYHSVPDPNNLPRIFTKETEMIARAAAVEEWFPVTQVGDAAFLRGVDVRTAPNLHGYVSTKMKPTPAQELLQSETEEPILARWRVGLGWTLAWTSDVKSRWSVEWLRWPGFEKFWGQLVHEHMRQKHRRELDMKAEVVNGRLRASVDAFGADERFENNLISRLNIIGPEPGGQTRSVDFRQTAPGRYEVDHPLEKYGSFLLRAEHTREAEGGAMRQVAVSFGHVSNPYPKEYASFEPDVATLEKAAAATGAGVDPANIAAIFDPAGEKVTFHEELWSRFVYAAIAVFLLDLFVRRVRLFDRKFLPKRAVRTAPVPPT
ncbi:VWA domain-containing protein [Polyangium aurulentum]|uniref:VWA domain-containing protein n=1 Tax=Polyangium aurulentum TaxID=2567896 RepID=UPI0010AEB990|nr:VWA domain-containing protein [Polyangium aurulentum]UQA55092.1 VWA domain-containing protein [Polyangium aurulentum]